MHSVSIVGCGYTGLRLAQRWRKRGQGVRGFATRAESLRQIAAAGAESQRLDLDMEPPILDFDGQLVYYTVPPAPAGVGDQRLERLLARMAGHPRRLIYFSTTGVYGDRRGAAVDEDTPPAPATARAARRLAAEGAVRAWAESNAVSWCILRIPGIYGPGRLPLERLGRRDPAIDPREAMPGNRIHVEDLVTACVAAGDASRADGRIYNVTDGTDDSLTAYLQRVARLAHLPMPPLVSASDAQRTFSPRSWSFLGESRRVDNTRMLGELGVALAYHDLDAGIRASLQESV
jgi:nucleoside-diphosphate-sugar epimerase